MLHQSNIILELGNLQPIPSLDLSRVDDHDLFRGLSRLRADCLHLHDNIHAFNNLSEDNVAAHSYTIHQNKKQKKNHVNTISCFGEGGWAYESHKALYVVAHRPSSQGVFTVVMKNCEPLVFGPAFAMDK